MIRVDTPLQHACLYTDACYEEKKPGHGKVAGAGSLLVSQVASRTHSAAVPQEIMDRLLPRRQQIHPAEALALAGGVWSNRAQLENSTVIFFVDNMGVVFDLIKGSACHHDTQALTTNFTNSTTPRNNESNETPT